MGGERGEGGEGGSFETGAGGSGDGGERGSGDTGAMEKVSPKKSAFNQQASFKKIHSYTSTLMYRYIY